MVVRRGTARKDRLTSACSSIKNRPRSFHAANDGRAGHLQRPLHQENFRGIGDFRQAGFLHFEHADLVGRAEAIFHGAQNAKTVAALAFEVKHRIDHVLEQSGTGDGAVLGHVADQKCRESGLFRQDDDGS